jgi:hypothetical protein
VRKSALLSAAIFVIGGIAAIAVYNLLPSPRDRNRLLVERQITKDKQDPITFQTYCGAASGRIQTKTALMLDYPSANVMVGFVGYSKKSAASRIDYFHAGHLIPLPELVSLLNCQPRASP